MERNQVIVVVVVLVAFIVAVAATLYFSGGTGIQSQRFRAEPGAMRENAQPMFSKRKDRDEERHGTWIVDPSRFGKNDEEASEETGDEEPAEDVSAEIGEEPFSVDALPDVDSLAPAEQLAREAAYALTPEEGLQRLAEGVSSLESTAAITAVYTTAAKLYMLKDPPDVTAAEQAIKTAGEVATGAEDEGRFLLAQANLYIQQNEPAAALTYLRGMKQARESVTPHDVEALLLLGTLELQEAGDPAAAVEALETAWEKAEALLATDEPGSEGIYRQATMRLTEALRSAGQEERAIEVQAAMRDELAARQ